MKTTQFPRICTGRRGLAALLAVTMVLGVTLGAYAGKGGKPGASPPNPAIVYVRNVAEDQWDIYAMDVDGGNQTRLTSFGDVYDAVRWSPDGTRLVFTRYVGGDDGVYTMNADGSGLSRVASMNSSFDGADWMLAPDGREWIVFNDQTSFGRTGPTCSS